VIAKLNNDQDEFNYT